jgi:hypothetical protein
MAMKMKKKKKKREFKGSPKPVKKKSTIKAVSGNAVNH